MSVKLSTKHWANTELMNKDVDLSNIKALVFDKDGTLINLVLTWLQPMRECAQLVANAVGQPDIAEQLLIDGGYRPATNDWTNDAILAYGDEKNLLELWSKRAGKEAVDSVKHQFAAITDKAVTNSAPMVDNFQTIIKTLSEHFVLGVASMDSEQNIDATLSSLEVDQYFSYTCGADSGFGVKPSGGMTTAFCNAMGIPPSQVAVVGDSMHDMHMGHNAGAISIGVTSGGHDRAELEETAEVVLGDISELPELFKLKG